MVIDKKTGKPFWLHTAMMWSEYADDAPNEKFRLIYRAHKRHALFNAVRDYPMN